MRRKQKARQWYLMGQLQASIGNQQEAYQAFQPRHPAQSALRTGVQCPHRHHRGLGFGQQQEDDQPTQAHGGIG